MRNAFAGRAGILAAGGIIGLIAALLQFAGNPANMGICVACFIRDIAGSLGLHQAGVVQYLRHEIPAFILGSFAAALASSTTPASASWTRISPSSCPGETGPPAAAWAPPSSSPPEGWRTSPAAAAWMAR